MGLILPYDEKIAQSDGCYITEEGEFILTYGSHSQYTSDHFGSSAEFTKYFAERMRIFGADLPRYPVQMKRFDRLRTIGTKAIESAYPIPNERFFNWLLMEWPITELQALVQNKTTGQLEYADSGLEQQQANEELNEQYGVKIKQIKLETPMRERHLHFK